MSQPQRSYQIWQKAQIHRKSCQIGRPIPNQPFELCQCCGQIIHTEPMRLGEHSKEFFMFGYGYPLWFGFLKHCILLVFVLIISKTATEIYIATQENYQFCYGAKEIVKHPLSAGIMPEITGSESQVGLRHYLVDSERFLLSLHREDMTQQQNYNHFSQDNKQIHDLLMMVGKDQPPSSSSQSSPSFQQPLRSPSTAGQPINPHGERQCTSILVYLSYFKQQKLIKDWFLTVIQFLAHLVALVYFRNTILKEQQQYNEKACLISDYTLIVENLPEVVGLRQSIVSLFEKRFRKTCGGVNSHIEEVIMIFQDKDLRELGQQKVKLENQLIEAEKYFDEQKTKEKSIQLQNLQQSIKNRTQQVRQLIDNDQVTCDKALITLRTQIDKVEVLQKFKKDQSDKISYKQFFNIPVQPQQQSTDYIFSSQILIKSAHQPNEIVWDNIDIPEKTRKIRSLIGWICTLIVLAIATAVLYFIIKGKSKLVLKAAQDEYQHSRLPTVLKLIALLIVIIALIGIILFNKIILQQVLRYIVKQQRHGYKDKENLSFAVKYAFAIFFTTGLMTLIVEAFLYHNYYTHHLGLIEQQSLMFFVVTLLIPLILWIHPYNIYKNYQREKVYGTLMRQEQANQMMEDYPYDMSKKYSEVFKLMWLTFLYSQLIPLGSFLAIIGLLLYYWVDKYNFINSCTRKPGISGKMSLLAVKSIDATLFMVPAGSFLFDLMLRSHFNVLSLVLMIVGIVYLFLPMSEIIWTFNDEKFDLQSKSYPEVVYKFRETYLSMHPVYSKTHKREIDFHQQRVKEYYQQQIKKQKIYGVRKGLYYRQQPGSRKFITSSE